MQPIFARIYKVDEEKREVVGRAAQETIDRENELMDYASSKPEFQKWSAEVFADTNGQSLGNVRSMHGNVAAGKLTDIRFLDDERAIDVTAKIVDDNEWKKCMEGVHTGFSIGGRYARKWSEPINGKMVTRYTAVPSEISIVDRPCIPTAKFLSIHKGFELHKRDGTIEHRSFANVPVLAAARDFKTALVRFEKGGPGSGRHKGDGVEDSAKKAAVHADAASFYTQSMGNPGSAEAKYTAEAAKATAKAVKSGKAEDHLAAAKAHDKAAGFHDSRMYSVAHSAATDSHLSAAMYHREAASVASKFDAGSLLKSAASTFAAELANFEKGGPGSGRRKGGGDKPDKTEKAHANAARDAANKAESATIEGSTSVHPAYGSTEKASHATVVATHSSAPPNVRATLHTDAANAHASAAADHHQYGSIEARNAHLTASASHRNAADYIRAHYGKSDRGELLKIAVGEIIGRVMQHDE